MAEMTPEAVSRKLPENFPKSPESARKSFPKSRPAFRRAGKRETGSEHESEVARVRMSERGVHVQHANSANGTVRETPIGGIESDFVFTLGTVLAASFS